MECKGLCDPSELSGHPLRKVLVAVVTVVDVAAAAGDAAVAAVFAAAAADV